MLGVRESKTDAQVEGIEARDATHVPRCVGVSIPNWRRKMVFRWGILTTNMSKSYINVLKGARHLLIRACFGMTFHQIVELFKRRRADASHCRHPFPSRIWWRFKAADQKAGVYRVVEFHGPTGVYKVVTGRRLDGKEGNTQTVKYLESECSCGKWQMYRLPCFHALVVCRHRGDNPNRHIDQ